MRKPESFAYRRLASPLHVTRAGVSALWAGALMIALLRLQQPLEVLALCAALLLCGALAGLGGALLRALRLAAFVATPVVLINVLVSRQGLTVFARLGDLGPFGQGDLTLEALVYGLLLALKLSGLILLGALASMSIDPDALLAGARGISFRSALTAALALRMAPLLASDARRLAEAQRTRPNPPQGLRARALVLSAVVGGSLERAMDVAATLELRGLASPERSRRSLPSRLRAAGGSTGHRGDLRAGLGALCARSSRHDLAFAASAAAILLVIILGGAQPFASFSAYPTLRVHLTAATYLMATLLIAIAVLPMLDRKGIER